MRVSCVLYEDHLADQQKYHFRRQQTASHQVGGGCCLHGDYACRGERQFLNKREADVEQ